MNGFARGTGQIVIDRAKQRLLRRSPRTKTTTARRRRRQRRTWSGRGALPKKTEKGEWHLPMFFENCTYFLCTGERSSASREWRRNGSRIFCNRTETGFSLIQAFHSISLAGIRTLSPIPDSFLPPPTHTPTTTRYSLFSLSFLVRRRRELILGINGGLGRLNENRLDELGNSRDRTEQLTELTRTSWPTKSLYRLCVLFSRKSDSCNRVS